MAISTCSADRRSAGQQSHPIMIDAGHVPRPATVDGDEDDDDDDDDDDDNHSPIYSHNHLCCRSWDTP